uniref:Uncharacterized protein n=1 Tax=Acrobeloides nanus TaxID=290746 RepID=A0A914E918_9BILA
MLRWIVLLSLYSIVIAWLLPQFPSEFHKSRKVVVPEDATYSCQNINFQAAQYQFNEALNITPPELTWRNVSQFAQQLRRFVGNSTNNFLTTCYYRTRFYKQLGATYSSCINRYYLLTQLKAGDNPTAAFEYPDLWSQLDFACNAGLQFAIADWYKLQSTKSHDAVENCTRSFFNNSTFNGPDQFCAALPTYLTCLTTHYLSIVDPTDVVGAWYWCEEARVVFNYDCPTTRCYVGANATFFQ